MFHALGYVHATGAHGPDAVWSLYEAQFNSGYGAPLFKFASKKRKKKASKISRAGVEKLLKKNRFLRDENEDLAKALGEKDLNDAKKIMLRLARLRDKFRIKAIAAGEGKTVRGVMQSSQRALITVGTLGLAKHWSKKRLSKQRLKRAKVWNDKAHAADELLLYWKKQFVDLTKKTAKKKRTTLSDLEKQLLSVAGKKGEKLDALEADGITADMPADVDDPKEAAAEAEAESEADAEAPKEEGVTAEAEQAEGLSGAEMFGYAALGFGAALLPSIIRR
jgi:hypothetical protein